MKAFPFIFLLTFLLSSCYSYKIFPTEYRNFSYNGDKKLAFVVNPELNMENQILKKSGIFDFTTDSTDENCIKIKLYHIKKRLVCGQPIVLSAITLGQFPVYFPDIYHYKFDEITAGHAASKEFDLLLAQRVWFW